MVDSDEEYEEEEAIVLVELSGMMDAPEVLENPDCKFKIIGLDSDEPVLQIGSYVFTGKYEDTIGTAVLFEEVEDKDAQNEQTQMQNLPSKKLKYFCKTQKKLITQRAFLSEKDADTMDVEVSEEKTNKQSN